MGTHRPFFLRVTDGARDVMEVSDEHGDLGYVDIRTVIAMCPLQDTPELARSLEDELAERPRIKLQGCRNIERSK